MAFTDKKAGFKYVNTYQKERYDRITVMATKGKKAEYQAAAESKGLSLSAFVMECVDAKINKMNSTNMTESTRLIAGLQAAGWDEKKINDFIVFIKTGELSPNAFEHVKAEFEKGIDLKNECTIPD